MKSSYEDMKKDRKLSSNGSVYIYTLHVKTNVDDDDDDFVFT